MYDNEYHKNYYKENKERIAETQKKCREKNKEKKKEYDKKYLEENREKKSEYYKQYYEENKERKKEKRDNPENKEKRKKWRKDYYKKNKEQSKIQYDIWCEKNQEKVKEYRKTYYKKNKQKINHVIGWRSVLRTTLVRMNTEKEGHTIDLLGYSATDMKDYLSSLFTPEMSWDNYGEWHIDHIKPVSSYHKDTPPNIVCALSNLQPLWATTREIDGVIYEGNLNKGDNYL